LAFDSTIRKIIKDSVSLDLFEHCIPLASLYEKCSEIEIDLLFKMEESFLRNGGDSLYIGMIQDILFKYLDYDEFDTIPFIYIPFADELDTLEFNRIPIISKVNIFNRHPNFSGYKYLNGSFHYSNLYSDEISTNQTWIITHNTINMIGSEGDGSGGGLPFRRCWCTRDTQVIVDGKLYLLSHGSCLCSRKDKDSCCGICERTGWNGVCSGDPCPGC
jgi:hypothetical protein